MRNLASIQKIIDIRSIEGADAIEVCDILGWHIVIAKKDNFKVGQLVIYIETDSVVPERPEFEFLRERKFRVKTIKLRGQVSQGLVLPLSVLPFDNYKEEQDVTELLGIKKYETASEQEENATTLSKSAFHKFLTSFKWYRKYFANKPKGGFPSFISKTDEERIQSNPRLLEREQGKFYTVTEKLDGQSATYFLRRVKSPFYFKKYEFGVCSRSQRLIKPDNSNWWKIAGQYKLQGVLESLIGENEWVAIQGEIIGEGIQGNIYGLKGLDFYVFNVITPNGILGNIEMQYVIHNHTNLKTVPFLHIQELPKSVDELVEISKGESVLKKGQQREGIVLRRTPAGKDKISFKVINPNYLLKSNR